MNEIRNIDCIEGMKALPDNSVDCCVTSPPYFGLRDYGHEGQIGMEESPAAFVDKMVEVFDQVYRILKPEGSLWLNLGDTYSHGKIKVSSDRRRSKGDLRFGNQQSLRRSALPPKNLIGIPWRVAFALQEAGWVLRQDIIWHKPNPLPESVTDRCTKAHEYIFLLTKAGDYYFDHEAILQPAAQATNARLAQNIDGQAGSSRVPGKTNGAMKAVGRSSGNKARKAGTERGCPEGTGSNVCGSVPWEGNLANKRSVWTVATKPFSEAHFATFPEDLIVDCIKAGCPAGGLVLDPFMGAGTTALVASKLGRDFIGFELNPDYITIARRRLQAELGMFNKLSA